MRKIGIAREPAMRYFSLSLLEIVETKYCNVTPFPLRNRPFSLSVYRRNVVTKCYCADFDLRVEVKRTGIRAKDRASVFFSSLLPRERKREREREARPISPYSYTSDYVTILACIITKIVSRFVAHRCVISCEFFAR